jgi:hypothetical protein
MSERPAARDGSTRQRLRIGAEQEVGRARADLELALTGGSSDPEALTRLDGIARQLRDVRSSKGIRSQRRNRKEELGLVLSERLLLDQLGFDSFGDYAAWRAAHPHVAPDQWDDDPAYAEFARFRVAMAEERLAAIDAGLLDRDAGDDHDAAEAVDADGPLAAWINPGPREASGMRAQLPRGIAPISPEEEVIGVTTLELPYWTEPT